MNTEGDFFRGELLMCWVDAGMIATNAILAGSQGKNGQPPFDWKANVMGAMGELAASLAFNLAWTGLHTRETDIGKNVEVRAVLKPHHKLIVQLNEPDKKPESPFVLVDLSNLPRWRIIGWYWGKDCKNKEWVANPKKRDNPKDSRPAYFVPREVLHDPQTLYEMCHEQELPASTIGPLNEQPFDFGNPLSQ